MVFHAEVRRSGGPVRPLRSRVHSLVRSRQAENSPSSTADRRAQTARPDIAELSSLISAQGRSGANRPGERRCHWFVRGYLLCRQFSWHLLTALLRPREFWERVQGSRGPGFQSSRDWWYFHLSPRLLEPSTPYLSAAGRQLVYIW